MNEGGQRAEKLAASFELLEGKFPNSVARLQRVCMPAYHHQQPRLDGLLLVKDFMELTFGVSAFWGRAGGRAGGVVAGRYFLKWRHDGLVDTVKVVDMGEPKLSWPDWNPGHRSSISPRPPPTAAGRLNLIEYPVQAGRQQPLSHPGEGGGLTRRARPLSTVSLASPSPHAADGSQRLFR
ncbi:hypothetical protein THAOC_10415 [Thalassiosira oceanica]|uniref:Uncharacterized protein n=1 Tax=Thalassiosira oceanica TaxID=159749 RepID=K0SQ24_THAOC|nr:hypothetical protein THAOC_10415 [Thalassiosira oceanica]|eukprot:EJK68408.1 hypothetical protein THAOC_10415 [Thalassiosira oceanica]